jgi:hypothetical protein
MLKNNFKKYKTIILTVTMRKADHHINIRTPAEIACMQPARQMRRAGCILKEK